MMIRDVLMVLLATALFVFALQPREHIHGPLRRETEALEAATVCAAFEPPGSHPVSKIDENFNQ